jgi:long-subunit acyl-CoA synthetase (AMP-forming)
VPRVWEKISEKLKELANSNAGGPKAWIATWAKSVGAQGSLNELQDKPTSFQYKLAKMLVFNNIRKALGLDQAQFMIFGAAPLAADIRHYFLTLGFPLLNGYGMSECSGPETLTDKVFMYDSKEYMKEAGSALPGTELKIVPLNPNETEGK